MTGIIKNNEGRSSGLKVAAATGVDGVNWQTGSIKTSTFTAANGEGYFANTSGGSFTMNLPAGTAGNIVAVVDYTNTFQTNSLTILPNGSQKIGGVNAGFISNVQGQSLTFIYVDDTEGWKNIQDSTTDAIGDAFISASGGTVTTCGNFKIHTFTGPGTFTVCKVSCTAAENTVGYLVVAGGGGGGNASGSGSGGGGAGGYREGRNVPVDNFTASPLIANAPTNAVTLSASPGSYPITVGGGGATGAPAARGVNSVFSTITATGGGGGFYCNPGPNQPGGSGGGVAYASPTAGGVGNTPPVSPPQGNPAGSSPRIPTYYAGSGGGGASAAGGNGSGSGGAGAGGAGVSTSISGSSVTLSGGGGAGNGTSGTSGAGGSGGAGGGGDGKAHGSAATGDAGTANTGGGGGGGGSTNGTGGVGGSGIVIIRYKFQ